MQLEVRYCQTISQIPANTLLTWVKSADHIPTETV
jgi:hypothetical protein